MPDANENSELPVSPKAGAYLLGLVAIACCARLVIFSAGDGAVTSEHFVWLSVCVIAAAFSAACAVVVAMQATASGWQGRE